MQAQPSKEEANTRALTWAVVRLALAQVFVLSLWFSVAAVLPGLADVHGLAISDLAHLSTATQLGFVLGALTLAFTGLADRVDPRRVFVVATLFAATANLALLYISPNSVGATASRLAVGAALAGVYPVALKLAVGWTVRHRGFVVSILVGALTLGSSSPHLVAMIGGADAKTCLIVTSVLATISAIVVARIPLGPFHARSPRVSLNDFVLAIRSPAIRRAYLGYLGHMWELYAFWAWIAVAGRSAASRSGYIDATTFGSALALATIALGGLACIPAGQLADRLGKNFIAQLALAGSFLFGLLSVLTFSWSLTAFAFAAVCWGIMIIPDSPQFSAMVADAAPPEKAGSLMALQTAFGFSISAISVQLTPSIAEQAGWPTAFSVLLAGPVCGYLALRQPPARARNSP